ncbi:MAG: hypothetical protein OXL34_18105 [Gemmatimonadota bacterium]|nr:hypothetical protein [Gemmatimonadota bacterium]
MQRTPATHSALEADDDPGVPEALPRTLREVGRRLDPTAIDRLWIFPPLIRGRREWGLVTVACFDGRGAHRLVTARYTAQRTGKGLYLETRLLDEGVAPADRLPRVMEGVVRRGPEPLGSPRLVELGGAAEAFESLVGEYPGEFFREPVVGPPPPG